MGGLRRRHQLVMEADDTLSKGVDVVGTVMNRGVRLRQLEVFTNPASLKRCE